jgi:hypothetical protein
VTEHQLILIALGKEASFDFTVFVACGSIAITILLTLQTTEIKDPKISIWWHSGFIAFAVLAVISLVRAIKNKNLFKVTIDEIKNQELHSPLPVTIERK